MRLFTRGLAAGALVLGSLWLAPVASAATSADPTTGAHCVQQVMGPGQSVPTPPHCFATYADSVAYTTGGRVRLATSAVFDPNPTDAAAVQRQAQIATAEVANAVHTLSIEYHDSNYGGSTYQFTAGGDCIGEIYAWSSMPSGWNDVISSSRAYSSCRAIHYDTSGATPSYVPPGAQISCTLTSCPTMGSMNDHTSSLRFVQN